MRSLALLLLLALAIPGPTGAAGRTRDDAGYAAWLPRLSSALAELERSEDAADEEQVRRVLLARPSGGAASYSDWLALFGRYLDKIDSSAVVPKILTYAVQGRPAPADPQYGTWLDAASPRMADYDRWGRSEQLAALQRLFAIAPRGTEPFYSRWLALYNQYLDLYQRWGRAETKTILDLLARVKPAGAGGEAPPFLRELEQTADQVTADPLFVDRYLDLTSLIKQKLAYQAANGSERARQQIERLRQIAR